jgi:DNA-binding HxlR family transcriptional regulator
MATLKRLGLEVMEDIHHHGQATRKQLWERNPVCSWEMFKRLLGKLTVDGVIIRQVADPEGATDPAVDTYTLTKEGHEIVQSLQC